MTTELEKLLRKEIEQKDEIIKQLKELVADLESKAKTDCYGCEHAGDLTVHCEAPSLTPCPKEIKPKTKRIKV